MKYTVIHPNAKIGKNVHIGPFSVIEEHVEIGDNCHIYGNVHIMNGTKIGEKCKFFPGAVVGAEPQDLKYRGEPTETILGNGVIVRECVTINRGTIQGISKTVVDDNCLLMAYVHVAHDCQVGERSVLANNTTLAGHINIGKYATLGGLTAVHQFVNIGDHAMIGGGSLVRKSVPHFVTAAREPLAYAGVNSIGLRRRGFTASDIHHIEDIYRVLFVRGFNIKKALEIIENEIVPSPYRSMILDFVKNAERGIIKGFKGKNGSSGNGNRTDNDEEIVGEPKKLKKPAISLALELA